MTHKSNSKLSTVPHTKRIEHVQAKLLFNGIFPDPQFFRNIFILIPSGD